MSLNMVYNNNNNNNNNNNYNNNSLAVKTVTAQRCVHVQADINNIDSLHSGYFACFFYSLLDVLLGLILVQTV